MVGVGRWALLDPAMEDTGCRNARPRRSRQPGSSRRALQGSFSRAGSRVPPASLLEAWKVYMAALCPPFFRRRPHQPPGQDARPGARCRRSVRGLPRPWGEDLASGGGDVADAGGGLCRHREPAERRIIAHLEYGRYPRIDQVRFRRLLCALLFALGLAIGLRG